MPTKKVETAAPMTRLWGFVRMGARRGVGGFVGEFAMFVESLESCADAIVGL